MINLDLDFGVLPIIRGGFLEGCGAKQAIKTFVSYCDDFGKPIKADESFLSKKNPSSSL